MTRLNPLIILLLCSILGFSQNQDLSKALEYYKAGLKEFGGFVNQVQKNSEAANKRNFTVNENELSEEAISNQLEEINSKRNTKSALLLYLFKPSHLEIYLIGETGLLAAQGIEITAEQLFAYETSLRISLGVDNFVNQNTTFNARGAGVSGESQNEDYKPEPYLKVLSEALFPPKIASKMKEFEHLFISPSYNISTVPIGCLQPYSDGYLIKTHSYTILPNLADFVETDYSKSYNPEVRDFLSRIYSGVIVGNPSYTQGNENLEQVFEDLPGAMAQSYIVYELITDVGGSNLVYLTGEEATVSRVKKEASLAKDLLYFATHGVTSSTNSLDSTYLVFTADETSKSGWWTTRDIFRHSFKCRIAALSACNTGSGGSTGVVGQAYLASAFYYAGVNHVIATLWSVDDQWTKKIMTQVVRELNKPSEYYPAQNIQRALSTFTEEELKYWAPFFSYGL